MQVGSAEAAFEEARRAEVALQDKIKAKRLEMEAFSEAIETAQQACGNQALCVQVSHHAASCRNLPWPSEPTQPPPIFSFPSRGIVFCLQRGCYRATEASQCSIVPGRVEQVT